MEQFLSSQERDGLKIQHRKERDKRICDRIKAVLLFDDGWDYQEIAHVLLLSDEAVKEHIREYRESQKLRPENGGSYSKLSEKQAQNVSKHLQEHTCQNSTCVLRQCKILSQQ